MPLPKKGKLLALDIGTRRTGVSISDVGQQVAFPREEILHRSTEELVQRLSAMTAEEMIVGILAGVPINMKGEVTRQTAITMEIIDAIKEAIDVPLEMMDERLTTQEARRTMTGPGPVDSRVAQIMLELHMGSNL